MMLALWAALALVAVVWPGRLAGPLDGAPLDGSVEAVAIGLLLPWLILSDGQWLDRRATRTLVVALLLWKAATGAVLAQDGWCLQFTSPVPLYRGNVLVPHSWDVRADWRSAVPRCSAVMTEAYPVLERFPAWFFNLPPAEMGRAAAPADRPPNITTAMTLDGYLMADRSGVFQVLAGEDVTLEARVDDRVADAQEIGRGVTLETGLHHVSIRGQLMRSHWSLTPLWNGRNLWSQTPATLSRPSDLDRWLRPWGRAVPVVLVLALLALALRTVFERAGSRLALAYTAAMSLLVALVALSAREALMRVVPLALAGAAVLPWPRRMQNLFGVSLVVGVPFLMLFAVLGAPQAGIFTWYSSGDDWWMFQRFAYRIFMQGYWLEGGEKTFWFQPLYRWLAGSLHMIFGDSSVGELFLDAGAALAGAYFAFHVTKVFAGFRWALVAAVVTLSLFTLGPAWYLFGRGLSEFASAGMIYSAALLALRGRSGSWPASLAAGVLATLAFYTRLNNLPMALAVAAFALPIRLGVGHLFRPSQWVRRASRPVLAGVLGSVALGLWLFTARTWYYTGIPSMLHGTTASLNSVWQPGDGMLAGLWRIASSILMLLTMNDPARFDVRALPVLAGFLVSVLAVLGVKALARLPLNAVVLCLAGIAGALVARGSAYPGRFSTHLIPVTVAIAACAVSELAPRRRQWFLQRSADRVTSPSTVA